MDENRTMSAGAARHALMEGYSAGGDLEPLRARTRYSVGKDDFPDRGFDFFCQLEEISSYDLKNVYHEVTLEKFGSDRFPKTGSGL